MPVPSVLNSAPSHIVLNKQGLPGYPWLEKIKKSTFKKRFYGKKNVPFKLPFKQFIQKLPGSGPYNGWIAKICLVFWQIVGCFKVDGKKNVPRCVNF